MISRLNPLFDGRKLRARRQARELRQDELADRIGTSRTMITFWELEQTSPTAPWMPLLAEHLECSVEDLLARPPVTLRERRYASGLTADQLGHQAGVHSSTLRRVESGSHLPKDRSVIPRWAEALDLTEDEWMAAYEASKASDT